MAVQGLQAESWHFISQRCCPQSSILSQTSSHVGIGSLQLSRSHGFFAAAPTLSFVSSEASPALLAASRAFFLAPALLSMRATSVSASVMDVLPQAHR